MKLPIILTIEPHEDGVRCGECNPPFDCQWRENRTPSGLRNPYDRRGPLCLAAEAKWRAVVEAGNIMGNLCGPHTNAAQAWISAVEEAGK